MLSNTHADEKIIDRRKPQRTYFWFITLRWIVVVGICVISLFARFILKIDLPLTAILIISLFILFFNCCCVYYRKYVKSYDFFANIQISVDWIALIFLVHYTGGIESPIIFYFIFHVIISGILLSRNACFIQTTFILLLIIGLSFLEYTNIISHVSIVELFPNTVYNNCLYLLATLFFFITTLYISAFLATTVTSHLRKRENEIVVLKNSITDAYNKLEALDRQKSKFTFKVIHELRSPLSAIQSLLKSIEEGYAGDISQKAKDLIVRSEKRTSFLITLVNGLLDLIAGKIGKPKEGDTKSIDINVAVKNTLHLMQEKTKAKKLKIIINATPKPFYLRIVPDDLDIILTNLIDNAVKYTKQEGTIKITNVITNKEIKVEISDTGIGITKEDLNKIFDEFYRSKNAKATEPRGTGLGLPIVKNLINQWGGNVDVRSEIRKGTTVTITFPL